MNDRYKFRGKRKYNAEWVFWFYIKGVNYKRGRAYILPDQMTTPCIDGNEVDPATVGQFTGLRDKNGVEIYEKDIVRHLGWEVRANKQIRPERIKLIGNPQGEYGEDTWIADLHSLWCICTGNSGSTVEVIGNIPDNPELMEVEG